MIGWILAALIVAALVFVLAGGFMVVRAGITCKKHLEALADHPLFAALERGAQDAQRLETAIDRLSEQAQAATVAVEKIKSAARETPDVLSAQVRELRAIFADLRAVFR